MLFGSPQKRGGDTFNRLYAILKTKYKISEEY